jgi:hypothetical protein
MGGAFLAELAAPRVGAGLKLALLICLIGQLGLIAFSLGLFFRCRDIYPIPSSLDEPIQSSWECWYCVHKIRLKM